jgi:hypothetical protein
LIYLDEKLFCIELLITQLFDPESTLNPDHRPKYIALLAYACSVAETNKKVRLKYFYFFVLKRTFFFVEFSKKYRE